MAWYYLNTQGKHTGPVTETELPALYRNGHVDAKTLFWAEGCAEWQALESIPELQSAVTAAGTSTSGANEMDELEKWKAEMESAGAYDDDPKPEGDTTNKGVKRGVIAAAAEPLERPSTPEEKSFVDDDGTMYIWDKEKRVFVAQAENVATYDEADMVFQEEEEVMPILTKKGVIIDPKSTKKQPDKDKLEAAIEREKEKQQKVKEAKEKKAATWFELKNNTSVYVTGLPLDVTIEEICEVFGKCGIIKDDVNGNPRVKIYRDKATGQPKGDGLVTFLRTPSVDLAINLLDDAPFRPEMSQRMSVSSAEFEMKGDQYISKKENGRAKKQKVMKQEKDLGWGGFDDSVKREKCTVVLKHMFTIDEVLNAGLGFVSELEADIAEECCKIGPCVKLKTYSMHPEGVVTVQFKTPEHANKCMEMMHGRWFGGNQVLASIWDGKTNYHQQQVKESEEEQAARLERYAAELER
mmetsp:Transcript_33783/g.73845  ORF Transcript_33783/g.73845 Transcript_33783/m.73845 type:complete len:467 (-) Transcript_33783:320-1720(-)|eukprot:CAMPEP_0118928614 /NCGR_PEP_ID=MMETSP1169-20130426/5835_1 /TAXON_ID=36882 /ORGANISM="Pyramimonas obovata, Strain CCMP722" /LENGTH=466 /DNA_ID=CAMNT_0006870641 /DNA_START=166 /DNA_END=1566 /DNA_ORIENTATION=-